MSSGAGRLADCTFSTRAPSPSLLPYDALYAEAPCTSTTVLHSFSMLMASLILGLAAQDAGLCSLCLNPFFAMLTIAYHTVVLALLYINHSNYESCEPSATCQQPSSPKTHKLHPLINPFIACLLSLAWLGAYIAMTVVLATRALILPMPAIFFGDTLFKGNALVYNGHRAVLQIGTVQLAIPQTTRVSQKIQLMFSAVVCVLLGNIALRGLLDRVRACRGRENAFV
ncbi:hypothetical protein D9619_000668 [Psilocybe cf. subviscida]|uniref:Uncharacterized protein n=1 Tax=Psilocybe cf. subviscida TaxID=2480587 RepID=A0A8H5BFJ3_9AGAR|nr:hypothetical protein D9619_000668 [Psilocybe cf. subviscida]